MGSLARISHSRSKLYITGMLLLTAVLFVAAWLYSARRTHVRNSSPPGRNGVSAADSSAVVVPVSYTYRIVNTYPHDPGAFTQGLQYEEGVLYEGTGGIGFSTLRKLRLETGELLQSRLLEGNFFGEGITIVGDRLVQLTYLSGTGFVYNKDSLEILERFGYSGEGWGLTYDGTHLIMSNGTSRLTFIDPGTYAPVRTLTVKDAEGPVHFLNELEFIKGSVYANIWQSEDIAIISPETGYVTGYLHLQGIFDPSTAAHPVDVLNGIAYDIEDDRLFVTGKLWPELFEIEIFPTK